MDINQIKSDLEKAKRQLAAAGSDDEKAFAQKKIDKLQAQLADAEKAGESKKNDEPAKPAKKRGRKKGSTKPDAKKSKPKARKYIEYKGVKYYEGTDEYCRLGKKMIEERKRKRAKTQGKYKTKSTSFKIGEDIADAVEKAIKSVPKSDIKEYPDKYVKRFRDLLKAGESFLSTFRAVLGEEYDNEEIKDSLDTVKALIDEIKGKVKTSFRKKMANGGEVGQTRSDYEEYLNELGTPNDDLESNGGRIPDSADYGTWLRRNDKIAFNVGYQEWIDNQ